MGMVKEGEQIQLRARGRWEIGEEHLRFGRYSGRYNLLVGKSREVTPAGRLPYPFIGVCWTEGVEGGAGESGWGVAKGQIRGPMALSLLSASQPLRRV